MDIDLTKTAAQHGRDIKQGITDPRVLTEVCLEAFDSHPQAERIYARLMPERARAEAESAAKRARAGTLRGPLDGVPVSWKDLFDTAGTPTEAGSKLLSGRTPDADASVVATASARGLVSLGKTHMSELAFSGLGLNPVMETPPNIHDAALLPGGSSSGAAASVAHGLAPLAIGSDTAGSVRIPAAWNDLVGLKTTHGSLPGAGIVPLCAKFDTAGPIARSVEDAALGFEALGGPATDLATAELTGTRFLVLEGTVSSELHPAVAAGFASAVERMGAAGAVFDRKTLGEVEDVLEHAALFAPEAYATWRATIEANPNLMFPQILERFRGGAKMSALDYVQGWQHVECLRQAYQAVTAAYDAVILPTCPILPPNAEQMLSDEEAYKTANLLTLRNTRVANLLGLCSLTLPTGVPSAGALLQAGPFKEARLLRLGAAVERALA